MNGILGVGPLEVLFVLILVLLVFGPEKLPELTRNLGRMIRRLKETYVAFVTEFKDELTPIATEIDAATRDLRQDLYAIREAADIRGLIPTITESDIGSGTNATPASTPTPTSVLAEPANGIAAPTNGVVAHATTTSPTTPTPTPTHSSNGHDWRKMYSSSAQTTTTATTAKVELSDDNPWVSIGAAIRSDKLDDDNPWRG
jgi:TatA/E family protein of Tat protein translocase